MYRDATASLLHDKTCIWAVHKLLLFVTVNSVSSELQDISPYTYVIGHLKPKKASFSLHNFTQAFSRSIPEGDAPKHFQPYLSRQN